MNKLMFGYSNNLSENQENLVLAFNTLVSDFRANKMDEAEYKENNAKFTESLVKYCVEATGYEFTDIGMVANPQLSLYNSHFVERFNTILAQAITPAVPEVTSQGYNKLYEVFQTGFGNNAKYEVESNEYFIVYDIANGIERQNRQTMYNTEYTITAQPKQIAVAVDWYKVAAGKFDFGKFGAKIAKSFEVYIQNAIIAAMTNAITNRASLGIGGYYKVGATKANWIDLAQKVGAANGSDVYALGTLSALGKIIPDEAGFRFLSDDDLVTKGYLPVWQQVPCFELKQAILPTTLNGANPTLTVPDDYIYFIPMSFNRPVKVLFEGQNVVVTTDGIHTKDQTLGLHITMRIGVDVIVGSKFGVLDVSN